MDKLNIHNLLLKFIKNNVILFALYFIFTLFQYPIHYIYIPEYYGKVINAFKDKESLMVDIQWFEPFSKYEVRGLC